MSNFSKPARVLWCVECSGAVPIEITVTTLAGGEDLSTVTGGFFHYLLDGATSHVLWAATVVGTPTARSVTLVHYLVTGDLTTSTPSYLDLTPLLTRPGLPLYPGAVARLAVTP